MISSDTLPTFTSLQTRLRLIQRLSCLCTRNCSTGLKVKERRWLREYFAVRFIRGLQLLLMIGLYCFASFRKGIVSFLGSHVLAWRNLSSRTSLLRTMSGIAGSTKLDVIQTLLSEMKSLAKEQVPSWWSSSSQAIRDEYIRIVISGLDKTVSKSVHQGDSKTLEILYEIVEAPANAIISEKTRFVVLRQMRGPIYDDLPVTWQVKLFQSGLAGLENMSDSAASTTKALLKDLPLSAQALVQLLEDFTSRLAVRAEPTGKRTRKDEE